MNEWVLLYYGNTIVTKHYNVSRHTGLGCQKWSVLALKEILMESAQDVTWWEFYQRPICAPGTVWNLFPLQEGILMYRQETETLFMRYKHRYEREK